LNKNSKSNNSKDALSSFLKRESFYNSRKLSIS